MAIRAGENQSYLLLDRNTPVIEAQPAGLIVRAGQPANLQIAATAESPLTYQWYVGNTGDTNAPIEDATGAQLLVLGQSTTASYWVRITGFGGSTNSNTATITPPATASEWAHAFGLASEASGPEQDPDGDGLNNLCEYPLGTSPASPHADVFVISMDSALRLVHRRNRTAAVDIAYEVSTDLEAWAETTPTLSIIDADPVSSH